MSAPLVTIGISFYNPGAYFLPALQSVFAQTLSDWELLLVDDGSTDGSLEVARGLEDPRVRVWSDGSRRTLAVRCNEMVRAARGKYFARMDADDVMHPERLERQCRELALSGGDTVLGTGSYSIDAENRVVGIRPHGTLNQRTGYAARRSFLHVTVMAAVEWFRRNPYTEKYGYHRAEDAELWCRTSGSSRFAVLPEPLFFIREAGVFELSKYLGTAMGALQLVRDYASDSKWRYAALLTREVGKIWVTCLRDGWGAGERARFETIGAREQAAAQRVLDGVLGQRLPCAVKSPSRA